MTWNNHGTTGNRPLCSDGCAKTREFD
jgi:hypothetical protein